MNELEKLGKHTIQYFACATSHTFPIQACTIQIATMAICFKYKAYIAPFLQLPMERELQMVWEGLLKDLFGALSTIFRDINIIYMSKIQVVQHLLLLVKSLH